MLHACCYYKTANLGVLHMLDTTREILLVISIIQSHFLGGTFHLLSGARDVLLTLILADSAEEDVHGFERSTFRFGQKVSENGGDDVDCTKEEELVSAGHFPIRTKHSQFHPCQA